jgi:hypothetical protein
MQLTRNTEGLTLEIPHRRMYTTSVYKIRRITCHVAEDCFLSLVQTRTIPSPSIDVVASINFAKDFVEAIVWTISSSWDQTGYHDTSRQRLTISAVLEFLDTGTTVVEDVHFTVIRPSSQKSVVLYPKSLLAHNECLFTRNSAESKGLLSIGCLEDLEAIIHDVDGVLNATVVSPIYSTSTVYACRHSYDHIPRKSLTFFQRISSSRPLFPCQPQSDAIFHS